MQSHAVILAFQGCNPNIARDTLSQYGDHSCEIVVKFDFKSQSYVAETILLKGHAVILTFKVKVTAWPFSKIVSGP